MSIQETIQQQIEGNSIVLYMKGTPDAPLCGFSARAVSVLKACKAPFAAVNVLDNPEIRQGIKEYSSWPTIPQIYIHGEFIGGSDILAEMFENGELQKLLQDQAKA